MSHRRSDPPGVRAETVLESRFPFAFASLVTVIPNRDNTSGCSERVPVTNPKAASGLPLSNIAARKRGATG